MARKKNRDVDPIEEEANRDEGGAGDSGSDEPVEVSVDPPEPDDDPDAELDRERPNRAERRANRDRDYRTIREQRAAAEAEAKVLREELERSRAAMSALGQNRPEERPTPEADTLEKELESTYSQQERLNSEYDTRVAAYANAKRAMPPNELEEFKKRAMALRREEVRIIRRIDDAREAPQRRQQEEARTLAARAPDVFGDERARQWAAGEYNRRVAENPTIDREQLFQETVEGARRVILGKRPPPDQAARQRASGISRGAGAAANGRTTVQMTGEMKRIARSRYPKLEPAQAYAKWAQAHGKEYNELERESGR